MKLIAQGAEAKLYVDNISEAEKSNISAEQKLIKHRIKKSYRIPEIDSKLIKNRTKLEAKLLSEARRAGVNTPIIIEVKENEIVMEFIEGERLKELFNSDIAVEKRIKVSEDIGTSIAKLHEHDIIHGDLTTSNLILSNHKIFFIDFGLGFFSKRIEDKATDLAVLKEALKSTHFRYLNMLWNNILKGYNANKQHKEVLKTLEKIEKRGRYVKR